MQFCDGMQHAAAHGLPVHRNITPGNCLLTQSGILKITGFGIATLFAGISLPPASKQPFAQFFRDLPARLKRTLRRPGLEELNLLRTHAGIVVGTPTHMSPEQFDGAIHTPASDIYSFGILLHQMVTGQLPWKGNSLREYERRHKTCVLPALTGPTALFNDILQTCLNKNPANRFADFRAVRHALAGLYHRLTTPAAPAPAPAPACSAALWFSKGESLAHLRRHQEALACFDRALPLDPDNAECWAAKGRALEALSRDQEALGCFQKAVELNPHSPGASARQAAVLTRLGQCQKALEICERLLDSRQLPEVWFHKGLALLKANRLEEAVVSFQKTLEVDPGFHLAWLLQGMVLEKLGQAPQALACLEHPLKSNPKFSLAWLLKGLVLCSRGELQPALRSLSRAVEIDSGLAEAWFVKAQVSLEIGRNAEALSCLDHLLMLNRECARAWMLKGTALDAMGREVDALRCFEKAGALGEAAAVPLVATARQSLIPPLLQEAVACCNADRWEQAFACANRILTIDPENPDGWYYRGLALAVGQNRPQEGLDCLNKALEKNPSLESAWISKGNLLMTLHRFAEAIASADRVLALNPAQADAWILKGIALSENGSYGLGMHCFEEAHRLGHPEAASYLVSILDKAYSGGDGSSMEQAVIIDLQNHPSRHLRGVFLEYDWIEERTGARVLGQRLASGNGRSYDVITAQMPSGETREFFFDISAFFGDQGTEKQNKD
jgi:tetratricopeptide (TPR) repeat protein